MARRVFRFKDAVEASDRDAIELPDGVEYDIHNPQTMTLTGRVELNAVVQRIDEVQRDIRDVLAEIDASKGRESTTAEIIRWEGKRTAILEQHLDILHRAMRLIAYDDVPTETLNMLTADAMNKYVDFFSDRWNERRDGTFGQKTSTATSDC